MAHTRQLSAPEEAGKCIVEGNNIAVQACLLLTISSLSISTGTHVVYTLVVWYFLPTTTTMTDVYTDNMTRVPSEVDRYNQSSQNHRGFH